MSKSKAMSKTITTGLKYDSNKPRWSLLPMFSIRQIIKVLEYGATKYAPDNWKKVANWRQRYYDAAMRHIDAWWGGERFDSETGCHHLAHACCCLIFILWKERRYVK